MKFLHRFFSSTLSISKCNILSHNSSMPWLPSPQFFAIPPKNWKQIWQKLACRFKTYQRLGKNIFGKIIIKSNIDLNPIAYQCALQTNFFSSLIQNNHNTTFFWNTQTSSKTGHHVEFWYFANWRFRHI